MEGGPADVASVLKDWERAQRKYAQASSGTDDALDELLAVLREHRDRIDASGSQDGVKDALLERLKASVDGWATRGRLPRAGAHPSRPSMVRFVLTCRRRVTSRNA